MILEVTAKWTGYMRSTLMDSEGRGSVIAETDSDTATGQAWVYIWNLWVKPQYRRQGLATQLLNAAEAWARKMGYSETRLVWKQVDTPVEILRWYGRMGYQEDEFGKGYSKLIKQLK